MQIDALTHLEDLKGLNIEVNKLDVVSRYCDPQLKKRVKITHICLI